MKKIIRTAISLSLALIFGTHAAFAQIPKVQYAQSENVNVQWEGMSDINTFLPGNVIFSVEINSKSSGTSEFSVAYTVDGNPAIYSIVDVPPAETVRKSYSMALEAGSYDININVSKKGVALYDKTEKINVIQHYEGEWGDELTTRGIGVHYQRLPYKTDMSFVNDLVVNAGLGGIRNDSYWWAIEKEKGIYGFEARHGEHIKDAKEKGLLTYWMTGNGLGDVYAPTRDMPGVANWFQTTKEYLPQTQESIHAYANYNLKAADYFIDNGYETILETTNEWNAKQWVYPRVSQMFTDNIRNIRIKMMTNEDGKYDNIDIATFTNHDRNAMNFINTCMEQDFYQFFDRFSAHKYDFRDAFESSDPYYNEIKKFTDFIDDWGGWKEIDITETGFSTPDADTNSTYESADQEVAKLYTTTEYLGIDWTFLYDLMNDGEDAKYSEHNFGAVFYDGTPKPHYLAMTNYNNQTSGGVLVGEINTGLEEGTRAYIYYKDGEPVVIAWANILSHENVDWNLGENVEVIDNHGNLVTNSTEIVSLGLYPVYIKGLGQKWINKAVHDDLILWNDDWLQNYNDVIPDGLKDKAEELFDNTVKSLEGDVTGEIVFGLYKDYINFGYDIISEGKNGNIDEQTVSSMLYRHYKNVERLNNLYMTVYSGECPTAVQSGWNERYLSVRKNNYNNMSIQKYTDAMLKYIRDYTDDVKKLLSLGDNPSKAGRIAGLNLMIEDLCGWYDAFSEYETVTEVGLVIQTPYYDRISYVNSDVTTEVNLNNFGKKDFTGTICVFDDEGNKVYETPQLTVKANGGYTQTSVVVNTKRPVDDSGCSHYYLSYVDKDGNILHTLRTEYEVVDRFEVTALPCTETVENLKSVSLNFKNSTNEEQTAVVEVESDGSFSFKSTRYEICVPAGESQILELPIASIDNNKYHFYTFKYKVTDENGSTIAENDSALSFTNIVKAENKISVEDFDGNIEEWADAYPIYINTPKNITTPEAWQSTELSTRVFLKWDEEHLYLLADIYDEKFLQTFTGNGMWQGDCIQLSIDPNNDKNKGQYATDDYELGFAKTPLGTEWYAWFAPYTPAPGIVDWIKMIRNDDLKFTRYLISLDKSVLTNVNLAEGAKIGLNVVINDNDYLEREGYYEFTLGTATKKDPSSYADFKLIGAGTKPETDGIAESVFPTSVENKVELTGSAFNDIKGHWAQEKIDIMSELGAVSGMGDGTFAPNKKMTRAELFSMVANAAGLESRESGYADVSADAWYAETVGAVSELVPLAMVSDGQIMPDNEITRQEAVYILSALCGSEFKDLSVDCTTYSDGSEVEDWAVQMMNFALSNRIIQGSTDGKLYPARTLTRAEAVTMLYNIMMITPEIFK